MSRFILSVAEKFHVTHNLVLVSYYYLKKLLDNNPEIKLNNSNKFIFVTVSMLLSTKIFIDSPYTNYAWEIYVRDVITYPLNRAELFFLEKLKYNLSVSDDDIKKLCYCDVCSGF